MACNTVCPLWQPSPAENTSSPSHARAALSARFRPWLTGFLVGIAAAMALYGRCLAADPPGPGGAPPPVVKTAKVSEQDVNPPSRYVGHVQAVQSVDLRARVEGFLEQVNFQEGSDVRAGDVLYVIEKAFYQAKVENDRALVAQAEASLIKARQFLQRAQAVRSGGIPAIDLDNARADEQRALAALAAAKATLKLSEINLEYTVIKAPISGRIGRTAFTRGNLVNAAAGPLARIVQLSPIRVNYSVSENDLVQIAMSLKDAGAGKNDPLLAPRIELPGARLQNSAGRVSFVDNAVDPTTGTVAVWATFDNPEGVLLPGQYVGLLVSRSKIHLMPVVPQSAVLVDKEGHYVLVVDGKNMVEQRRVKTGALVGASWAIETGVASGETIIVDGIQKARPGQAVKTAAQ